MDTQSASYYNYYARYGPSDWYGRAAVPRKCRRWPRTPHVACQSRSDRVAALQRNVPTIPVPPRVRS